MLEYQRKPVSTSIHRKLFGMMEELKKMVSFIDVAVVTIRV